MKSTYIGKNISRKEGPAKVAGRAKYIDDLHFPDMIHGVTVRSSVPRARIKGIRFEGDIPWDEIIVVSAQDIPGQNAVALLTYDQPFLADGEIRHPEEPILLLAHADKYLLEEARRHVIVDVEPLPAIFTIEDSLAQKTVIWGEDNIFKTFNMVKGDVDSVWNQPGVVIVEGEYQTGSQEQLYIENNGMIAVANAREGVTVWGSMQCPYYVHKALMPLFDLPGEKVRIIQSETGGGFGGKEEYPSLLAGHAALLALKSGKPVKMIYDRAEDMVATTKRHPSKTKHRTAVTSDGKLLAMDIEFLIDGGAYNTLSPVVLSRGTIHAAGPYFCPNVRIHARAVATNTPPQGAFRGFGAPQSIFAVERHLNQVAKKIGLAPEELRRRNFVKKGLTTATGQLIEEEVDQAQILDRALKEIGYFEKKERFDRENPTSHIKRGVGFATFFHGAGFTGSGERNLASIVGVEADASGRVRILAASTEIGQGTNTVFSQIAADTLHLPFEMIDVAQPDTARVPNSGPTVASRTSMVVGKLVETAVENLRQILLQSGLLPQEYSCQEWIQACQAYIQKSGPLKTQSHYKQPPNIHWDDEKYQGDAYGTYAWATYAAEVSIDTVTFETRVEDFVAIQEIGKVLHPMLAAGQIEGGVAQGIGYSLYEEVKWKEGRMANGQMTNYIMPTSMDLPPIRVFFEETPYAHGPSGAKGIGELPMDGPAPAILNAIEHATGKLVNEIPLLPERMMEVLSGT